MSSAIGDAVIVNESGTQEASIAGVFGVADGDALTITAKSSDDAVASAFVGPDNGLSTFTQADGAATITVAAKDSDGNLVSDTVDVSVVGGQAPVENLR